MLIREVYDPGSDQDKLAALAQFLVSRAEDTDSQKVISTNTFLKLAHNMGISLTADQLKTEIQKPPLSNIIANVEGDSDTGKIIFQGSETVTDTMTVDQARQTVDAMAKRAIDIK